MSSTNTATPPTSNDRRPVPVKLVLLGTIFIYVATPFIFINFFFFLLLGESAVGKSSLVIRFVNREYAENREPTIGGKKQQNISSNSMYHIHPFFFLM